MSRVKRLGKWVVCFLGFLLLWFGVVRVTSGFRELKVSGSGEGGLCQWDGSLRIACYNIAHGRGGVMGGSNWDGGSEEEREKRLGEIGALIRAEKVDVLVLNEVDFKCTWSHEMNQAEFLAEACGFPYVVEQRNLDLGIPFLRVAIGNAILSRFPIESAEVLSYPAVKWWEPILAGKKKGVVGRVSLPDGSEVEVFAVHLETRDEGVRKGSLDVILEKAGARSVLAGDFNSVRRGDGTSAMDLAFADGRWQAGDEGKMTFPTTSPDRKIDWVLVPKAWQSLGGAVRAEALSDHALLVSEWEVR